MNTLQFAQGLPVVADNLLPISLTRHPATTWNQKKIWEAEQADLKKKKDEASANKELKRDSDRRFYENLAGGKPQDASAAALNFMYNPPPGYQQVSRSCCKRMALDKKFSIRITRDKWRISSARGTAV